MENKPDAAAATSPMIVAENLVRTYSVSSSGFMKKGAVNALAGASFTVQQGKTLAVVGESGCGKSTLARLLTLIETPTAGRLQIDGMDVAKKLTRDARAALRQKVQIVFQDPYGSLNPRQKIGAILSEPLIINTRLSRQERRAAVDTMLERVGLRPEHYNRYPHMFSGGQRQRIAIARALMLSPKIVVLDEPVSALDVSVQAQVLNLLQDLKASLNLTFIFISHDLSVVRFIADDLLVMYLGKPVEYGSSAEIFNNPQHPYTQALLSSRPIADPVNRAANKARRHKLSGELPSPLAPPSGCLFHPRCPFANERCKQEAPQLLSTPALPWQVACHAVEEQRDHKI